MQTTAASDCKRRRVTAAEDTAPSQTCLKCNVTLKKNAVACNVLHFCIGGGLFRGKVRKVSRIVHTLPLPHWYGRNMHYANYTCTN
jgi:hypothetical protein